MDSLTTRTEIKDMLTRRVRGVCTVCKGLGFVKEPS